MKFRICLTLVLLIVVVATFGQKQRMALLPSAMNYGGDNTIKTLCIDYFRPAPDKGDIYEYAISNSHEDRKWVRRLGDRYLIEGFDGTRAMQFKDARGNSIRPLNIKQTVIISQISEEVDRRYLEFITSRIQRYGSANVFNKQSHSSVQREIWEYNILERLKYLGNEGDIEASFTAAKELFANDFGPYASILNEAGYISYMESSNRSDGDAFKLLVITKSEQNQYVIFDHVDAPALRTKDALEVSRYFESHFSQHENVYTILRNFGYGEKPESFLSTIRMDLTTRGKRINVHNFPYEKSNVLLSKKLKHKLQERISSEAIETIPIDGKNMFSIDFEFMSEGEGVNFFGEKEVFSENTMFNAQSNREDFIRSFLNNVNIFFSETYRDVMLLRHFALLRKDLMKALDIRSEDEFTIRIQNEFEGITILKRYDSSEVEIFRN